MKPVLRALAALTTALALSGCGLESERPNIWLENNSEQTVILQARADGTPVPKVTAPPGTRQWSGMSPLKGYCAANWEIVDATGKVLKKIDRVCAYDTVVYP